MSRAVLAVLLATAGCQCFQPVDERADAGVRRDGGSGDAGGGSAMDAGSTRDAGSVSDGGAPACMTAADCPAPGPMQQWCGQTQAACVNGFCLLECPTPPDAGLRTCTSSTAECLTCNGATRTCGNCNANLCTFSAQPVRGTCPPPFDDFQNFVVQPFSGRCGGGIVRDGGLAGVWVGMMMNGRLLIDIPALGGACLGSPLATQVPRTLVSCPACTFVAEGCE